MEWLLAAVFQPRKELPMTSLRKRMIEDMQVRNRSPHTQAAYVQQASLFSRYFDKSPVLLGPEDIRTYQIYLGTVNLPDEVRDEGRNLAVSLCRDTDARDLQPRSHRVGAKRSKLWR